MKPLVLIASLSALCLGSGIHAAAADEGKERPVTNADAGAGRALYVQECSGCHGERGRGDGPGAAFADPKPRNFLAGPFKFRTTPSGQPPATQDIMRIIERGIPGTAMPSFSYLSPDDRKKIAAYVLKLADMLEEPEPEPVKVDLKAAPKATPQTIARGKQMYLDAGCGSCHGATGKGDGPSAKDMKDSEGNPVKPRDFTDGKFRGGGDRADLFYRLTTGIDGSPMPQYADVLEPADRWAIADYVLTLKAPPPAEKLPADPIEAGRAVAAKYSCRTCHVLDDGQGGEVGPDLRISGQKLQPDWVRAFLKDPRKYGKIYPWRVSRMPHLGLSDEEARAMAAYLAKMGNRPDKDAPVPDAAKFPATELETGKNMFVLTCSQCHALGKVIETPLASQQGPDLIRAADRLDFEWEKAWLADPKKIDPNTKMVIPALQPDQIDGVRMFIWKTAEAEKGKGSGAQRTASR